MLGRKYQIPVHPSRRMDNVRRGFMLVTAAAVACAILFVAFLLFRSVNLTPAAAYMASIIEETIQTSDIATPTQVEVAAGTEQQEARTRWRRYVITAEYPDTADIEALEHHLRREMAMRNVGVAPTSTAPNGALQMRFLQDGHELVLLQLYGGAPEEIEPEVVAIDDRISECERLYNEVRVVLAQNAVPANAITQSPPEVREEEGIRWQWSRFEVRVPPLLDAHAIADEVESGVGHDDAFTMERVPHEDPDIIHFQFYINGFECMELFVAGSQAGPVTMEGPEPDDEDSPYLDEEPEPDEEGDEESEQEQVAAAPQIAIIVDDGGYGGPATEAMLAIDAPLTLSIFPSTPFSRQTAEAAQELGFEIMIHVPMESYNSRGDLPDSLRVSMGAEKIQKIATEWFDSMPMIKGANNHTGSKFTANKEAMEAFLQVVKDRDLYFVDSRTHLNTVAHDVAVSQGIPARPRDLFIDNEANGESIREHMNQLVAIAVREGSAIGICHFREKTAVILKDILPELEKKGVELVFASALIPGFKDSDS